MLYNLVYGLMGKDKISPLPHHTDEESLANDFANYFMSKIEKIREELEGYILYKPQGWNIREFSYFRLFSVEEVRTIIMGMKTKSCEMDPILTELLKKCIVEVLPTITKIINISLRDGCFCGYVENCNHMPITQVILTRDTKICILLPCQQLTLFEQSPRKMCNGQI